MMMTSAASVASAACWTGPSASTVTIVHFSRAYGQILVLIDVQREPWPVAHRTPPMWSPRASALGRLGLGEDVKRSSCWGGVRVTLVIRCLLPGRGRVSLDGNHHDGDVVVSSGLQRDAARGRGAVERRRRGAGRRRSDGGSGR